MEAATHLPLRAGHNWMHTAKAGAWGAILLPMFLSFSKYQKYTAHHFLDFNKLYCKLFSFFRFFGRLGLETGEEISYNALVYA